MEALPGGWPEVKRRTFRTALLSWYAGVARPMPWRVSADPYRIWLSEVMLQQTRVDQALPYFERFVAAFPDVYALAGATIDDVLRHWEGLGYYSRARHLHQAARRIVDRHGGAVPATEEALLTLPGVGPYTAAAILSIAFRLPFAVLDGNVMRVLSRLFAWSDDLASVRSRATLQCLADDLLDAERPGDFNQAMMELGATVCTPRCPRCTSCPVSTLCLSYATGRTAFFPVKAKKTPVPLQEHAVGILRNESGEILLRRRSEDEMLGGLWTFPGGRLKEGEPPTDGCRRWLREGFDIEVEALSPFHRLSHAYSHFKLRLHAFAGSTRGAPAIEGSAALRWLRVDALSDLAFDRASRRLADRIPRDPGPWPPL
jgi:A/G-specific adenine glycosylase